MLLKVENLSVLYDGAVILNDINLHIDKGEMVSLVGPNGAGKTTLLKAISGMVKQEKKELKFSGSNVTLKGKVFFNDDPVEHLLPHEIAGRGLIHCPERHRPFAGMTVYENLLAGGYLCRDKAIRQERLENVYELFPRLNERKNQISGTLSGGEQQMLAIGRSLMMHPELLCIDEPSMGLAPKVKRNVFEMIQKIQNQGIPILLVEQDVRFSFSMSSRNYILSSGEIVAEGDSDELLKDETVSRTYLGL